MTEARLPIAIAGAGGRMGQALLTALAGHARLRLGAALHVREDLAGLANCAAMIDFTVPDAVQAHAGAAAQYRIPWVIGTTGLDAHHLATIAQCARIIPVVQSANMSVGVNLLAGLVEQAAARLGPDYDIEIVEMHHRRKKDAPSGTALMLGESAARGRGVALADMRADIDRNGQRPSGEIGFAVLRGGDVAGDHTVCFAGEGERLELTHRASSRAVFAEGALRAAEWAIGKPPALYTMRDVIGFS